MSRKRLRACVRALFTLLLALATGRSALAQTLIYSVGDVALDRAPEKESKMGSDQPWLHLEPGTRITTGADGYAIVIYGAQVNNGADPRFPGVQSGTVTDFIGRRASWVVDPPDQPLPVIPPEMAKQALVNTMAGCAQNCTLRLASFRFEEKADGSTYMVGLDPRDAMRALNLDSSKPSSVQTPKASSHVVVDVQPIRPVPLPARPAEVKADQVTPAPRRGLAVLGAREGRFEAQHLLLDGQYAGDWRFSAAGDTLRAAGDLDGDGYDELVVTNEAALGVLEVNAGTWSSRVVARNGTRFGAWELNTRDMEIHGAADFDGDGVDELLVTCSTGVAIFALRGASLTPLAIAGYRSTLPGGYVWGIGDPRIEAVGDVDGDGRAEFVVLTNSGLAVLKLQGQALTHLTVVSDGNRISSLVWKSALVDRVFMGDFDAVRGPELFVPLKSGGAAVLTWGNNGLELAAFAPLTTCATQTPAPQLMRVTAAGDFNGDGVSEALLAYLEPRKEEVRVMSLGAGALSLGACTSLQPGTPHYAAGLVMKGPAGLADLDADGDQEVVGRSVNGFAGLSVSPTLESVGFASFGKAYNGWTVDRSQEIALVGVRLSGQREQIILIQR